MEVTAAPAKQVKFFVICLRCLYSDLTKHLLLLALLPLRSAPPSGSTRTTVVAPRASASIVDAPAALDAGSRRICKLRHWKSRLSQLFPAFSSSTALRRPCASTTWALVSLILMDSWCHSSDFEQDSYTSSSRSQCATGVVGETTLSCRQLPLGLLSS